MSISVTTHDSTKLAIGETRHLTAEILNQFGHPLLDSGIAWTTSKPEIAEITADGVVVAKASGTTLITASSLGLASTSFELSVADPDYTILVALYYATNGESWQHSDNWLSASPMNSWYGIDTDSLRSCGWDQAQCQQSCRSHPDSTW